jgi:hypothetical protein
MRRRIHAHMTRIDACHMRRRIHALSYAEEDTCMTCGGGYMHDICGGGYMHVI